MNVEELLIAEAIKGAIKISLEIFKKLGKSVANKAENQKDIFISELDTSISLYVKSMFQRYGYMKVLGMNEPILLKDIFINVHLLNEVSSNSYKSIEELEEKFKTDKVRSLNASDDKSLEDGIKVVNQNQHLIVLGPPGSGKSTFLKKIAFECLNYANSQSLNNFLPVIIELRKVKKGIPILNYVENEFNICKFPHNEVFVNNALSQGRLLVIFDGIDEINESFENEVFEDLQDFIDKYDNCKYVISSRNLAYHGEFKSFKDVEISNFSDSQIIEFINKWFAKNDADIIKSCTDKLFAPEYIATKELAQTPLLLTLICLVYSHQQDFPQNRSVLYKEAIDVLLKEWNAEKRIYPNPIYSEMTLPFEEMLLSKIAYDFFIENNYFFGRETIGKIISTFISENLNAPKFLDGKDILKAISLQQGILIERAKNIYTFSHLTFQEYFTAKYIDDNDLLNQHIETYLEDNRWREVFLLLSGMSRAGADRILLAILNQIKIDANNNPALANLFQITSSETQLDIKVYLLIIQIAIINDNRGIEAPLSSIARELDLKESYILIASYIIDFRLHIPDHFDSIFSSLKANKDRSDNIYNIYILFDRYNKNKNKSDLINSLSEKFKNSVDLKIDKQSFLKYINKVIFLVMCRNSAILVKKSTWEYIESNLFSL